VSRRAKTRARRTSRQASWRRLALGAGVVAVGLAVGALVGVFPDVDHAIQELTLPLHHEDVIRQQAAEKNVDAALIAAVIYAESKFSDQTSAAGARGLMQITPEAAKEIERLSGGTTFRLDDLSDPEINIRYGTYLLGELLNRFGGDEVAALAAYNAGPGNVEKWGGSNLTVDGIPFPETRAYVEEVLEKRQAYRSKYATELGY
jgi:soluble lytic murein transglycosylase